MQVECEVFLDLEEKYHSVWPLTFNDNSVQQFDSC